MSKRAVRSIIRFGLSWKISKHQRDFLCGFDACTIVHYRGTNRRGMEISV